MKDKLIQLEKLLDGFSEGTGFSNNDSEIYPDDFRQVHSYKLFGNDLLAIPASLIIEGDEEEFEKPFSFVNSNTAIRIFESEFRAEIPTEFVQIGNFYGATEIVLLNILKGTIHVFHVADIVDSDWLKYKLDKEVCNLNTFIENLRPQTVCCLMNPKDHSKWDIFEIRNNSEVKTDNELIKYESSEEAWIQYKALVKKSIGKGYAIHYAPGKLKYELGL